MTRSLKLQYTMRAVCWDGVVREFAETGYFLTLELMDHWLAYWSGDRYQYFETPLQAALNALAELEKVPPLELAWWGKQQHEHVFVDLNGRER